MLSFNRLVSLFALFISFALFAHALPTGVIEARTDATDLITKVANFQKEMDTLAQDLNKTAATGESPTAQIQKIATSFSTMTSYLGKAKVTLTSEQEEQISIKITDIIIKTADAANTVAAAAKYVKWYTLWTDLDVAMHSFVFNLSTGTSYRTYQLSLKNAGTEACNDFHQMKMRHMVNDLQGMGVYYN